MTTKIAKTAAIAGVLALTWIAAAPAQDASAPFHTNESEIAAMTQSSALEIFNPVAVFAFVMKQLPQRVQVYPTENYYYFHFVHSGVPYMGNIRLTAANRDRGQVAFAYSEQLTDWNDNPRDYHAALDAADGVTVEKIEPLVYRITLSAALGGKTVTFALNDLSQVKPPTGFLTADERYLGPSFDESGMRFFFVFNKRLKVFHFLLDETAKVPDQLVPAPATDRILIGKRTGFAFYQFGDRKVLIGVNARQSRLNTYYDGPFDQLPENFIQGDSLLDAIVAANPSVRGKIDRLGNFTDGNSRFLIHPYLPYREISDLAIFHRCATTVPAAERARCFVIDDDEAQRPHPRPLALKRR
jgi:hypothetical protein